MDKVRVALVLITVAITIGPVLGMVLVYRNDLPGLVIPSGIDSIMSSMENSNPANTVQPDQVGPSNVQYDMSSRTFTANFPMRNPFPFDTTIVSMTGTIECDEHNFALGPAALKNPVSMGVGETVTVTVQGTWTEDAGNHLKSAHQGEKNVSVSLVGASLKRAV
jgi:hypothetical protein